MANNFEHTQNASLQYSFVHLPQKMNSQFTIKPDQHSGVKNVGSNEKLHCSIVYTFAKKADK